MESFNEKRQKKIEERKDKIVETIKEKGSIQTDEVDPIHFNKYGNVLVAKVLLKQVFGIDFDHEKFIQDLADNTKKYPGT